jgi:glycogen debranching enzyme
LAACQADAVDENRDAEPGKILHEVRAGEMAALGEIPFGRYYGSVDSTPLFVMLLGAYWETTGDLELVRDLWPNALRALEWIARWGDHDFDGFVEYGRRSHDGLVQQGWKDSHDSVFHADGSMAEGPIALCEVQGYVYAAWRAAALADAGSIESRNGKARVTPAPCRNVRRDSCFFVRNAISRSPWPTYGRLLRSAADVSVGVFGPLLMRF